MRLRRCFCTGLCATALWLGMALTGIVTLTAAPHAHALAAREPDSIVVLADRAVTRVMLDVVRTYARETGTSVSVNFDSSEALVRMITDGAPADVIVPADGRWIETLRTRGLVDIYTQVPLFQDTLVLIASPDVALQFLPAVGAGAAPAPIAAPFPSLYTLLESLGSEAVFVMGEQLTTAEGALSRQALEAMDMLDAVEPWTLYVGSNAISAEVAAAPRRLGLAFAGAAAAHPGVRILATVPAEFSPPATFQTAVVAGEHMTAARAFVEYLRSEPVTGLLRQHGLQPVRTPQNPAEQP